MYFNNHNHTDYSNALLGFPDVICTVDKLIQSAYDLGLQGITITEHEGLSSHIQALNYYNAMKKERPFVIALGNEIYLMNEQEDNDCHYNDIKIPYYHFILTALDTEGHKQLRELSTRAWIRAWKSGRMFRRATYYSDFEEIVKNNQGHLIASSACLGSRLDHYLLNNDFPRALSEVEKITDIFGEDNFYLEIQPSKTVGNPQSIVNTAMWKLHTLTNLPIIPTTDTHYLTKADAFTHKIYLQSQDGEREVDDFYATAYLMGEEELKEYLLHDFNEEQIEQMFDNSIQLGDRIKEYNIKKFPIIPQIPIDKIPAFEVKHTFSNYYSEYPNFAYYASSERPIYEQFFFYEVEQGLNNKVVQVENKKSELKNYISRLDEEWKELRIISEELKTSMPSYYSTMKQIIDLIWEAGSLSMPARGSAAGFLTCYLLEITQIDPVPLGDYMPSWRHLNSQRGVEIADIDNDSEANKKQAIIDKMKEYFGEDKVLNVATFSKISSKTAIERACKGLNISDDTAGYLKSLIPVNRGKVLDLYTCLYGNKEKDIKPITELKKEIKKYNHLEKVALGIEGLITNRGTHAAGVIVCNEPYTNYISAMRSADGTLVTCYDLWDAEEASCIKFDMLTTVCADKIHKTMDLLLEHNKITWEGSLKKTYYKWLHPDVLNYTNKKMWDILPSIYSVFQFDTPISQKALSATNPHSVMDLSATNSLLRLMPDNVDETPIDKYKRYKADHNEWLKDTKDFGLNETEQSILWQYLSDAYGLADSQEKIMRLSMDNRVSGYSLKEANKLRKSIAKKDEKLQAEAKKQFFEYGEKCGTRYVFLDYIWNVVFAASLGYSFSQLHSYSYSIIALQELNLNYFYPKVYWNCACLSVEASGNGEKNSTDYGEVAKAIYKMKQSNIEVSPPDINNSDLDFTPIEDTNSILYGLAGISGINQETAKQIISFRPYNSFEDFYEKNTFDGSLVTPSKIKQLIKAGCFDCFNSNRIKMMKKYIMISTPKTNTISMANINNIKSVGVKIPQEIIAPYNFFKYITNKERLYGTHPKFKSKKCYWLNDKGLKYFEKNIQSKLVDSIDYWEENGKTIIVDKSVEKILSDSFQNLKEYINTETFKQQYYVATLKSKYLDFVDNCESVEHWSMDALSYYTHNHELSNINKDKYNISNFNELPQEPQFIEHSWGERSWKQYDISAIAGTVIDKNDNNHLFTLLTDDNIIVNVKMNGGAYAFYKAQISATVDGRKEVIEKPWLSRGNLIIVTGYRRGESDFVSKKYKNSIYNHQIQKILKVDADGNLEIQSERYAEEN